MRKTESIISLPNKAISVRLISWITDIWIEKMFGGMCGELLSVCRLHRVQRD